MTAPKASVSREGATGGALNADMKTGFALGVFFAVFVQPKKHHLPMLGVLNPILAMPEMDRLFGERVQSAEGANAAPAKPKTRRKTAQRSSREH